MDYKAIALYVVSSLGGASLLIHEGVPRVAGLFFGFVLRHPAGRAACVAWEPQILQAIQDTKDAAQKSIDAEKAHAAVLAAPEPAGPSKP